MHAPHLQKNDEFSWVLPQQTRLFLFCCLQLRQIFETNFQQKAWSYLITLMLISVSIFDLCSEHFEEKQKRLQEYYDQRSTENAQLHQQNEHLQQQIQQLQEQVSASEAQNQQSYQQLQSEVQKLQKENKDLDTTLQEYRKECESLMSDYRESADQLHKTEVDRDKYKNQYETALRELAQRAERIKQLEQQRKEATERNEHMSFQVSRLAWLLTHSLTSRFLF